MKPHILNLTYPQRGMALLEVLISILLFAIGILGVVGLQANMAQNATDSIFRTEASFVAQKRAAELWASDNVAAMAEVDTDISMEAAGTKETSLPAARRSTAIQASGTSALIVINWTPPDGTTHSYSLYVQPQ